MRCQSHVCKKSLLDGSNPYYLSYGGYGVNLEPNFQYQLPSLLNRGFIYAMPTYVADPVGRAMVRTRQTPEQKQLVQRLCKILPATFGL
ncbi:hypothetical protein DSO57_1034904 [Entomophthora muscae]|uniref:Uncharacterized protein n=1 Tax=Entomophthora muscae TaxID=34485 RepID=A0ACC2SNQ8_9FUNG|nr:hypothetical protein DSO57_1034904 [Entomophthora muscae]